MPLRSRWLRRLRFSCLMTSLAERKRADRAAAMERRAAAHRAGVGADRQAAGYLLEFLAGLRGVETVSAYIPIRDELNPLPAMLALHGLGYRVGVPVIEAKGRPLQFREWHPEARLSAGSFGVHVPDEGAWVVPQALIVPMLAFDRTGSRLGYGGGFYDRTLAALREDGGTVHAIGFAYAGQEVGQIPIDETDAHLDVIVTEAGLLIPERSA